MLDKIKRGLLWPVCNASECAESEGAGHTGHREVVFDEIKNWRPAPVFWWVLPCYCEAIVLPLTIPCVIGMLKEMMRDGLVDAASRVLFVDDGSSDETWTVISAAHAMDSHVVGVRLARNSGHQNALVAGMMTARKERADAVVTMDADLQDDISAVREMVMHYRRGCDIVYGVRSDRASDTVFKRWTAQAYYRVLAWLGADIVYNHADFRLLGRRALDAFAAFPERNLFLRGIVPMLGYRHATVRYERHARAAGESKYPLKKMLMFAWQGITSLSTKPIRMITALGTSVLLASIVMIAWCIFKYGEGVTIAGWTSVMVSVWFFGGVVTLSLGIVGEYVGKAYLETKQRPRYLIAEYTANMHTAVRENCGKSVDDAL